MNAVFYHDNLLMLYGWSDGQKEHCPHCAEEQCIMVKSELGPLVREHTYVDIAGTVKMLDSCKIRLKCYFHTSLAQQERMQFPVCFEGSKGGLGTHQKGKYSGCPLLVIEGENSSLKCMGFLQN